MLGAADQLGFGTIAGGNLEMANTTVSDELVSIIRAQQSFSGMSRVMQAEVDMVKRVQPGQLICQLTERHLNIDIPDRDRHGLFDPEHPIHRNSELFSKQHVHGDRPWPVMPQQLIK